MNKDESMFDSNGIEAKIRREEPRTDESKFRKYTKDYPMATIPYTTVPQVLGTNEYLPYS